MAKAQVARANRREDRRLITGCGRYASDWNLANQLHAGFLRSDRPHAEILSIDSAGALECATVVAVFTGADAIAAGYTQFAAPGTSFTKLAYAPHKTPRPVLAYGKVRFVGEAVALVVADTALAAQDALDAIEIDYRDLPAATDLAAATAKNAPVLHDEVPGNLAFEWHAGDAAAVAKAFQEAAHVTRIKVATSRVVASPLEPRAYVVSYDADADSYDVYTSAQGISTLCSQLSILTGLPEQKLRLHLRDVGGSFGQRTVAYPEHAALMIAAKKLGRPVKWVSTRSEGFLSDCHGRGIDMTGELALDGEGKFLAARYSLISNMGAYLTPTGPVGHLRNTATSMTGVYRIPALQGHFQIVVSNTCPLASYRGAGRPDIAYVVERLVDQAAAELNMDRAELRRRNFIPLDAFPYQTPILGVYEQSDFAGCLDKALKAADWAGFEQRRAAARELGKLRGIGIATVIEGTGSGRYPQDQVALEVDGQGAFTLYTATLTCGQGHETTFPAVAAQTLGIAPEAITLLESVQDKINGNGTGGSRSLIAAGSVCKLAAQKLILQALPLAAEALELEPSLLEFSAGAFRSRDGTASIGLLELAKMHLGKQPHPLNVVAEAKIGTTFPNGCHIAEVEIDPDTGTATVVSYVAADDCGIAINHYIVEGQVHGGVVQGAGQIFGERVVYDRHSGQLLSGSFNDYYMPRAGLIREIRMSEHPLPSKANVLGAKGVGESGCTASIPALASAVIDALRPLGINDLDMPFTPSKVWAAIQKAKAK